MRIFEELLYPVTVAALFIFTLAAMLLLATPAAAAEITRHGDVITIKGDIEAGDEVKFARIREAGGVATVILNSNGGHLVVARVMGDAARFLNYETYVPSGAICNSACAMIWIAGAYRSLGRNARIGVHSVYWLRSGLRDNEANAQIAKWLADMGVHRQLIELWPKADPCCVNYIDHNMAREWGLLKPR